VKDTKNAGFDTKKTWYIKGVAYVEATEAAKKYMQKK
jgi:hypothetical protein